MRILEIDELEPYWDLLLLADPSPELVQSYLKSGKVFGAIIHGVPVGVYVLVHLGDDSWELKNIAVHEAYQGKGYGQALLRHSIGTAKELGACSLEVGTASSGVKQVKFYEQAGFKRARIDEGFFVRNYDEPVLDDGVLCVDMLYLKLTL